MAKKSNTLVLKDGSAELVCLSSVPLPAKQFDAGWEFLWPTATVVYRSKRHWTEDRAAEAHFLRIRVAEGYSDTH